jgi:hypothetical protein
MERYSTAVRRAQQEGRQDWAQMQGWIEKFICNTSPLQNVVGNRDHPSGGKITQAHFDANDKTAHVCPFVIDAIVRGMFYIESSELSDVLQIRKLLLARIEDFKKFEPAYDPIAAGELATMPLGLKAFLIFFPNYQPPVPGPDPRIDQLYKWMIVPFLRQGLILGQFYRGCREEAVHNPSWKNILTSPYLAFVVRYLQPHDSTFIRPGTPGWPIYQKLLPPQYRTTEAGAAQGG